ncbi:MAG: hypothetical protein GQ550_02580, partial [Gammaproteobacteria bacterium]|nr:hypothetical protein [Gammaproteobacteria bacterium]
DDILVTFDDEAASGTNIENICNAATPTISGSFLTHLAAPNNLSAIDGEDPSGTWTFQLAHSEPFDPGTLNEVCITAAFAAVTFDKWVSTNNTCSDTLDTLTVSSGTDVYYCYTASNPSTETFSINPGDAVDDQGHDISALETTYVQGASQTVVVGPITAGSATLPDNVTTINNAQVTASFTTANFTGNLVTSKSASLTVTVNPPLSPANGAKQLYLSNLGGSRDLTRIEPTANTTSPNITFGSFHDYDQTPVFQSPFTITGSNTVNVFLILQRQNGDGAREAQVELFNGNTGALLGTDTWPWNKNNRESHTFTFPIATDENFSVGDFVRVRVSNISANGRDFILHQRKNTPSQIQMQTSTVINIDSIGVFSAAYPLTSQFSSYEPGRTVYIRATVSDPFGNADITNADITITDPTPAVQVNAVAMPPVATPTGATLVYEYQYTIPATPDGLWDISIIATEGFEATPITHTAQSTMVVGIPGITISKNSAVLSDPINASNPKAIPGAIVEYAVAVSNSGFGYVDTDTVILTDPLAAGSTFFFGSPVNPITFTDGATSSGLTFTFTSLASTTDDVDFSNDGGGTFITPTTDASGFDTTSPPINYIRINPKGGFRGSDGVNDPSMQVNFRVRVE